MTMRLIPHAAAMTEFVDGFTGTCGEDAGLALAHVVDPVRWPLNAATLAGIARWEIGKAQASANGSEPLSSIASWLASVGINHTNYGYSEPPSFDWRGMLARWGGIKPITFEYAKTSAGLVGDEAGVGYHFNTCLGWDPEADLGLFADGDNVVEREGGTALVRYTLANLDAAQVCGMLVGEYELGGVMTTVPSGWSDNGTTLSAPGGAASVGTGFRTYILEHAWEADDVPIGPETDVAEVEIANDTHGAGTVQYFRYSALIWSRSEDQIYRSWVGREAMVMRGQIATLQQQMASVQANLQAAQQQRDALSAQLASAQQQVTQLQQQLASAQAAAQQTAQTAAQPTAQQQALDLLGRALKAYLAS